MRDLHSRLVGKSMLAALLLGPSLLAAPAEGQPLTEQQLEQRLKNPNALWEEVQVCLKDKPLKQPCVLVNRRNKYVILHDIAPTDKYAYLIVPTFKVTGIEDPKAWKPPVADFWKFGWEEGKRLLQKPPEDMGLAINSVAGRGQNQLHIHISCVKKEVHEKLKAVDIPTSWKIGAVTFEGQDYDAIKVPSLNESPFLVLEKLKGAKAHMGKQSLAVIGAEGGGFYLLDSTTTKNTKAVAEVLLAEMCGM